MAREAEEWVPPEILKSQAREERALALERDRLVRSRSVAKDTILNLPVSVPMPDGEELYRGATSNSLRHNYDQHSEITKGYIQGPPNKTVWDSPDWTERLDWRDWDPGVPKSCSRSPGSSQPRPKSSQSTGQLSSWGLHWRSGNSGKSPPSHSRTRCRHSHPSNSKNSCSSSSSSSSSSSCKHNKDLSTSSSSSTCSSTSSSTSSCAGLLGVVNSAAAPTTNSDSNCASNNTVTILSSIGGKIQNAFSDKVHSCESTLGGGGVGCVGGADNAWTNPNSSVNFRVHNETKFSPKNSKSSNNNNNNSSNSNCSSQQNSKIGKSHSGLNDITRTQTSSSSLLCNKSERQLGIFSRQEHCQSPPPSSLNTFVSSNHHHPSSGSDFLSAGASPPSSLNNAISKSPPSLSMTNHHHHSHESPTSSRSQQKQQHQQNQQQVLNVRLMTTKVDGGTCGMTTTTGYQTPCEGDSITFSQNLFQRVNDEAESNRQNFECSILNDDNGNNNNNNNDRGRRGIQPEKCIGDIQCRLEDVQYNSSSSSSDSTRKDLQQQHEQNKHTTDDSESECEPFLS